MSEVILFLTHKKNFEIEKSIRRIKKESGDRSLTILAQQLSLNISGVPEFQYNNNIVREIEYPAIGETIVPGNAHFPLFYFYFNNRKKFDFYWLIEYDVRFNGDWLYLFDHFKKNSADFITSHLRRFEDEPDWSWWKIEHPTLKIPKNKRIRSFNPIYRISSRAIEHLDNKFKTGWCGHNEVTFPTLLFNDGFNIIDFGGDGEFATIKNKFYISRGDKNGSLKTGTFRYRPAFKKKGIRQNKLYHPVKEDTGYNFTRLLIKDMIYNLKRVIRKSLNLIKGFM